MKSIAYRYWDTLRQHIDGSARSAMRARIADAVRRVTAAGERQRAERAARKVVPFRRGK